jgi:hypothetical protein
MLHLCMVMPDTDIAPDAWTEATTNWTSYGAPTSFTDGGFAVDGAKGLAETLNHVGGGTYGAYRTNGSGIDLTAGKVLHLYYMTNAYAVGWGTINLKIHDGIDANKYWTYILPVPLVTAVDASGMLHYALRLPDANGDHGWTKTSTPDYDYVTRITLEVVTTTTNTALYWDVLYIVSCQRTTSKYTLSNPVSVARVDKSDNITGSIVATNYGTVTMSDATAQAIDGVHQILADDQSITTYAATVAAAAGILNAEGYGVTSDPVRVEYLDPGDMYNVVLGDTLTITDAKAGLSSAKRTLVARDDRVSESEGWATTLHLSGQYSETISKKLLDMAIPKRY